MNVLRIEFSAMRPALRSAMASMRRSTSACTLRYRVAQAPEWLVVSRRLCVPCCMWMWRVSVAMIHWDPCMARAMAGANATMRTMRHAHCRDPVICAYTGPIWLLCSARRHACRRHRAPRVCDLQRRNARFRRFRIVRLMRRSMPRPETRRARRQRRHRRRADRHLPAVRPGGWR